MLLKHISTQNGNCYVAIINGESRLIEGDVFRNFVVTERQLDGKEIPFCNPSKIVALGLNYRKHAEEFGSKPAVEPIIFLKPTTSIVANGQPIVLPKCAEHVEFEGEIAVVVKSTCKGVSVADVPNHILGYTIANDVTERILQKRDGQWTRAKGFDTFLPTWWRFANGVGFVQHFAHNNSQRCGKTTWQQRGDDKQRLPSAFLC